MRRHLVWKRQTNRGQLSVEHQLATGNGGVAISFAMPSAALRRYVSTYYLTEIGPTGAPWVEDYLHPEWGNVRIGNGGTMAGVVGEGDLAPVGPMVAAGPTSRATRFRVGPGRVWGIGLLPLGWARFVDCAADRMADRIVDALADPAFAAFAPLASTLFGPAPDPRGEAERIDAHMLSLLARPAHREDRIVAAHAALADPEIFTVTELSAHAGLTLRGLERLSKAAFGFAPKLLMRRQRFVRSLGQFMLDPSLSWMNALDAHYYDQAHFIRDFRRFIGMTPSAYAALPHPILGAAARARTAAAGAAMQALHVPEGSEAGPLR